MSKKSLGIGSDETILHYKNHRTLYNERERLFMVKAVRYVTDAYVNAGSGVMDFVPTIDIVWPGKSGEVGSEKFNKNPIAET